MDLSQRATPPVRRPPRAAAINFAIDRDRVVAREGGREVGQPSCQILPSGFPGYEPYCPYTAKSGGGRGWSAPDMERARRLVAASGRAGERVVVHAVYRTPSPATTRACSTTSASARRSLSKRATRLAQDRADADGLHGLAGGRAHAVHIPREQLRLRLHRRGRAQRLAAVRPQAGTPDRPSAADAARGGRTSVGGRRPPRHRPRSRGAAHQPTGRGPRLEARGQRQDPRPVVHAARPDVGSLTDACLLISQCG